MALLINDKFAPRANPGDANYPNGSIKNESAPGVKDGTPLDADWGNDYAGFDAALFAETGITPSGDPDTALSSQRLTALQSLHINDLLKPIEFPTVAAYKSFNKSLPVGKVVNLLDRKAGFTVISGVGSSNGMDIISSSEVLQSINLITGMLLDIRKLGAIEGQDATTEINRATDMVSAYTIIDLGGSYIGENITANKDFITYRSGKVSAPLDAVESCFVVTGNNVEFQKVDTFVDWANLTATGVVNVGGIVAINADGLRIIGGNILGGRSDSYNPVVGTIDEVRAPLNLYRCTNAYIAPKKVGECGFVDALGIWESFSCEVDGGLYENGQYSGIATATDEGTAPVGDYGRHTIRSPKVRGMGTSSITVNDARCQVLLPDVDGGLNGVNFGHSSGQPGVVGIIADNSSLIGGTIRNTTAHGVAVGNSKNIKILGPTIEDTGGSGIRLFDNCDGSYIGSGVKIKRSGDTMIGYSIGNFVNSHIIDGVDGEMCESHGIYAIGGTSYTIRNTNIKDVDNSNANRNVMQWDSASIAPKALEISGVSYEHENSASPANRGVSVSDSVAALIVDIHDCNLIDVAFEKFLFGGVAPTSPSIYKNRLSTDPLSSFVTFLAASTTQLVTNGNLTAYSVPKITHRDKDCHTRSIYVTSPINGSFIINGDAGGDADFSYEV